MKVFLSFMPKNGKRIRNLYDPQSSQPFKISRSKIDLFLECPRCFYLDRRLGVSRPEGPPFTLNKAVDVLLKKEFDIHRAKNQAHPLMHAYGIDAVPFAHELLDTWRENFKGIEFWHKKTNLIITGAIDDVWVNPYGELIIIDYKATSTKKEISLDDDYKAGYKLQMEVYQWLFRQNGFKVSPTGYFLFCNGDADKNSFDGRLEFTLQLIPYRGDDGWVEPTIYKLRQCLDSALIPPPSLQCDFCAYRQAARGVE